MDKSTHFKSPLAQGIMRLLDHLSRGKLTFLGHTRPEPLAGENATPLTVRGYAPASHRFVELALGLSGQARLNTPKRVFTLDDKQVLILLPGASHAETYFHPRKPYHVLWTAVLPSGLSFFISQYDSGAGFSTFPERFSLQTPRAENLWSLAALPDLPKRPVERARFQADLISIVCDVVTHMDKPFEQDSFHNQLIGQIRSFIDQHFTEPLSVEELARIARCTPNYLNTLFRQQIGVPIHRYLLDKRLELAKILLREQNKSVKETAYQLGFHDPLYFSRLFRQHTRHSPSKFKLTGAKPTLLS